MSKRRGWLHSFNEQKVKLMKRDATLKDEEEKKEVTNQTFQVDVRFDTNNKRDQRLRTVKAPFEKIRPKRCIKRV
jgi:hypothetical protein